MGDSNSSKNLVGIFDSGVGGLSVLREIRALLPSQPLLYFGDQAHVPYGKRQLSEIQDFSFSITHYLLDAGARLIVVACNTASAIALRRLQQTWLPGYRARIGRPVNVLGIIVPTIEAATGLPWEHEAERRGDKVEKLDVLAVFSTAATARGRPVTLTGLVLGQVGIGAIRDLRDLVRRGHDALRLEPARGELEVVTRRAHRDGDAASGVARARDSDFERLFGDHPVFRRTTNTRGELGHPESFGCARHASTIVIRRLPSLRGIRADGTGLDSAASDPHEARIGRRCRALSPLRHRLWPCPFP